MIAYRGHDPVTCPSREWSVNCCDRVYAVGVGRLQCGETKRLRPSLEGLWG